MILPGGAPGIGFDDLRFAPALGRFLVPGGRAGTIYLIDPASLALEAIGGFSASPRYEGGHDVGVTSADEGRGAVFAIDRSTRTLAIVEPKSGAIVGSAKLAGGPDYVRFVPRGDGELWVTEPDAETIEIFALDAAGRAAKAAATIAVPGGPESLVVDAKAGRAYTHLWKGTTVAIDLASRAIVARWPNGCEGSRGIDRDETGAFVLVGCAEGKLSAIDAKTGRIAGELAAGAGVDVIAYAAARREIYAPAAKAGSLTIARLGADGSLAAAGSLPSPKGSHCAAADPAGHVIACDPQAGAIVALDRTR